MNKARVKLIKFYQKTDKYIFYFVVTAFVTSFLICLFFVMNFHNLPSLLPLYYSLSWGKPQLVSQNQFLILPAVIILITLVNLIASWHLHSSQLILKRILASSSAIVGVILLITAAKIIYIFI